MARHLSIEPSLPAKRLSVFARFVADLTTLSKCTDKHTAAIIVNGCGDQIYSIGINGGARHDTDCLCVLPGKYTCIHAEQNAIAKCTAVDDRKIMICSYSPCVTCAALIINSGFSEVYFLEEYKDKTGIQMLRRAGIHVFWLKQVGGDYIGNSGY